MSRSSRNSGRRSRHLAGMQRACNSARNQEHGGYRSGYATGSQGRAGQLLSLYRRSVKGWQQTRPRRHKKPVWVESPAVSGGQRDLVDA
ncbi:hypothetical protein TESG_00056 [Trichophyton tonsurans CBS 112818]|uniref:Uncharacterized protein n=1 Tax=Trichophyton tonsurans (strain CBS 112818) TaxID=647933 RepID=F2RMD2_TRIT1|nr:hypothetical protein TESG_00056 [Trichophyton tonsurans CBS 112818]